MSWSLTRNQKRIKSNQEPNLLRNNMKTRLEQLQYDYNFCDEMVNGKFQPIQQMYFHILLTTYINPNSTIENSFNNLKEIILSEPVRIRFFELLKTYIEVKIQNLQYSSEHIL